MQRDFTANHVSVEEDREYWLVGFADAEFNPKRYILLQRERQPSALDAELGLAGYQIELGDQNHSCYGGIETLELLRDRVTIAFDDDGVSALSSGRTMVVRIELRQRQLNSCAAACPTFLRGANASSTIAPDPQVDRRPTALLWLCSRLRGPGVADLR